MRTRLAVSAFGLMGVLTACGLGGGGFFIPTISEPPDAPGSSGDERETSFFPVRITGSVSQGDNDFWIIHEDFPAERTISVTCQSTANVELFIRVDGEVTGTIGDVSCPAGGNTDDLAVPEGNDGLRLRVLGANAPADYTITVENA